MRIPGFARLAATALLAAAFASADHVGPMLSLGQPAQAQEDDSGKILKSMADYLTSQKTFSVAFDSAVEVVTSDMQKIQFASSGKLLMSRPDKIRVSRTGGYADVEFVFDGKTASLYGKHLNAFVQFEAPGTVDQLVDRLRSEANAGLPGADLLALDVYAALTSDVIRGAHIGRGVIDGIECEHLAFRGHDADWQIWIEVGDRPLPLKYVITSKGVGAAPEYTLVLKDWKTDAQPSADAFSFTPAQGAAKVALKDLSNLDEVPAAEGAKP
jgi:hypothetical protein